MEIVRVQTDDKRIPLQAQGPPIKGVISAIAAPRLSDDGKEAFFQIGVHEKSGAPHEVAVAVENGAFVFLPERSSAHVQLMDMLGIERGHAGD